MPLRNGHLSLSVLTAACGLVLAAACAPGSNAQEAQRSPAEAAPPPKSYMPVVEVDFDAVRAEDEAEREAVMQRQRAELERRYDLADRPADGLMMSGGRKAVQEGVRVRLPE